MNIIFTGMRGTGKTTLGKLLAEKIQWDFIDIDQEIQKNLNQEITKLVEQEGWDTFREIEHQAALECANRKQTVISTGGGTMMHPQSAEALKKNGHVILLTCDMDRLKEYLIESYERPSLKGQKSAIDELDEIWDERKDQYHAVADTIHDTTGWPPIEDLLEKLQSIPDLNL